MNQSSVERFAAIGDSLDIICPYYEPDVDPSATEQSIIYRVTESDYETCTLSSSARELGRCIAPMRRDKVKVSFRLLSPNPSALDYRPGHTYFFISTSTGTPRGLENRYGGLCAIPAFKNTINVQYFSVERFAAIATSTGTPRGLENRYGGLCASHQLKMVIHVTEKNGDTSSHIHRVHRKPVTTTTTTTEAPSEPQWPSDPLWGEFFEKVATSTGTPRGLENRYGGLCASHQLKMVIHVTEKNGDTSSHIHRVHRKPITTTTTTTEAPSEPQWPSDPLWGEFFEKVGQ
ncbi:unnamed protein product, partial [Strongylus vulgaris]